LQPSCWRTCFYHPHRRRIWHVELE
jgi:hypothetical protein